MPCIKPTFVDTKKRMTNTKNSVRCVKLRNIKKFRVDFEVIGAK